MYNVFVLYPVCAISCIFMSCTSSSGSKLMFWHFRNKFMDYSFFYMFEVPETKLH
jgi:hypothetical protein